jgi:N-acyl amino acid synthase of PEP-CTERM/exosortase system
MGSNEPSADQAEAATGQSAIPPAMTSTGPSVRRDVGDVGQAEIQDEPRLVDLYEHWFQAVIANTPELRREAFRLRYQVYCVENPFEDPADNPNEEESDAYDAHSAHGLLIHRPTGMVAGTVRLVLPKPDALDDSFALHRVCHEKMILDHKQFPVLHMAEVSRFSISKGFRKRRTDGRYPDEHAPEPREGGEERRVIPHMTLGLIESLVRMSVQHRITYWCAVMEPTLLRLLSRLGIYFDPIGPLVDYHGRRQPCYIRLSTLLTRVARERPDVWEVLTDRGRHWDALLELENTHHNPRRS